MSLFFYNGVVAQRSEQRTHNPLVRGSNPFRPTNLRSCSLTVEHLSYTQHYGARLAHDLGSNPSRTTIFRVTRLTLQ